MTELATEALVDLVETLATVVNQFTEAHPDIPVDQVEAAVGYFHGSMFRLASGIPPSKLH